MENEKRKSRLSWLIILLLIIIIIILLFFWRVGKVEEKYLVPTGNVDVFDIDVRCGCKNKEKCDGNDKEETINYPVFNPDKDKDTLGRVFIDDKNGDYIYQENLRIFDYSAYEYDPSTLVNGKIAPGVSNTYYFVVHNSSDTNVNYNILMYEESQYQVNMKYRLKKNDQYVVGNDEEWVNAEKLKTELSKLNISSSDKYALDWKWFDDDENDTIAGSKMNEDYKLNVRIYFEAIE